MAKLCPLFSGSNGNSYYIGSSGSCILIDAGRSAKQLETAMRAHSLEPSNIQAIFVTHEHADHVQGVRVMASRYHIPVYSSPGTLQAMEEMGMLNGKFPVESIGEEGVCICGMQVTAFHTSHDSRESVGYVVHTADGRKVAFATDLGFLSDEVFDAVLGCDAVVIESNHDIGMLQNGYYPYYLKRRILSNTGHLSNAACAGELPALAQSGTTRFVLAHLSRENNLPQLAYQTALCSLQSCGMQEGLDFQLMVAPPENLGEKVVLF